MHSVAGWRGRESAVPGQIPTGDIHHLRLTVTDLDRSRQFYTGLLSFAVAVASLPLSYYWRATGA